MATISNSSISQFLWEEFKGGALTPGGVVTGGLASVGIYLWIQHLRIDRRAQAIFKELQVSPKNTAVLHQAIQKESFLVLYSLLEKIKAAGRLKIFELELGEKKTTSIMVACQEGKWDVLAVLLAVASIELRKEKYIEWMNQQDRFSATAIHKIMYYVLARQGSLEKEKLKIEHAINSLSKTNSSLKDAYGLTYPRLCTIL